jgi:hypothetical protein
MWIKEVATEGSNLGKMRAEHFSFYPLLGEGERNGAIAE